MKLATFLLAAVSLTGSAHATLIGNWNHDELSGSLIDSTGLHPEGTPTGTLDYGLPGVPNGTYGTITVTAATGTAIGYGPSDVDELFMIGADTNNPVMNLAATGQFTVMGWMNPFQPSLTARSYKIMSTGSGAGGDRGWALALRLPTVDGLGASVRFTGYGIADNDSSTFSVTFGTWIHLAATYDNGVITYFLNGEMLDSDTRAFGDEGAAARLLIGGRVGGNDADQMNGLLDGVRVYDQVLSTPEIQQAALLSVSVPEPSVVALGAFAGCFLALRRRR